MPPKFKFTRREIVDTALALVRRRGSGALTTRTLADALGASARPIYSFFGSMDELHEEIVKRALELLSETMTRERTGDPWQDHGIGYVLFAHREKHLFRCLNDETHIRYFKRYGDGVWNTLTASLADYAPFRGLSAEQIHYVQVMRWLLAHGLAFQASNPPPGVWDERTLTATIQAGSTAILAGLRRQFAVGEANSEDQGSEGSSGG